MDININNSLREGMDTNGEKILEDVEVCGGSNCQHKEDVDTRIEPNIGMEFDTTKEAFDFYNTYARYVGFSVRVLRTNNSKKGTNKIIRQALVCSCEGTSKKIKTPEKKRDSRRFDCKARFVVKWVSIDKYRVIEFNPEHTHDLVPFDHSHYLRSQRKIEFSQVELMKKMSSSGLKQTQIFSYMCEEAGGAQNLNFTKADCKNLLVRTRAEFLKKGDAECLLEYFKEKKEENKHFFYSFRTHEDGEIRSVFFCDAKSRRDYGLFGDAVSFDTTFRTNNYDMLCAPIVGINNHGQTILFGCGLLDGETIDAVMWLFMTFLEAMGGKKPSSIFTDQSAAISKCVDEVFPEAHHGLCLWHLCQNAARNLANCGYKSFASQFKDCIYNPETIEEFEQMWEKFLENNGLRDNEWLQRTYEVRKKWAQVYSHAHFCAGMTTSQRSESINKFLKDYFGHGRIVLREFVNLYARATKNRREKEKEAAYLTQQTTPTLVCNWSVEREAAKKYTKKVFYLFQESLKQTIDLSLELKNDDGNIRTYIAKEIEGRKRIRTLKFNYLEDVVSCTCRKFEFDGILCSHALKLFRHLEFKSLPSNFYLKRWTRAAIYELVCDPVGDVILNDNDPMLTARYSELSHISQKIVTKGSRCTDGFALCKSLLLEVETKLHSFMASHEIMEGSKNEQYSTLSNEQHEQQLKDPKKRRSKGQSSKRIKGPLETKQRKKTSSKVGILEMSQQACYSNHGLQWTNVDYPSPYSSLPPFAPPQTIRSQQFLGPLEISEQACSNNHDFQWMNMDYPSPYQSLPIFAPPEIIRSKQFSSSPTRSSF